ncbi:MAG: hypothetical protein Q9195_000235 [Heterodermia aff. obscurata]
MRTITISFLLSLALSALLLPTTSASPTPILSLLPHDPSLPLTPRYIVLDPSQDGGNEDDTMIGPGAFQIPNSGGDLTASLGLNSIVSPSPLRNVLNQTSRFVAAQLAASGDGQLPPSREPFVYDLEQGAWIKAASFTWWGQHFTWGMLQLVLAWLYPHLAGVSKFRQGGMVHVVSKEWGPVGTIEFQAGFTGNVTPEVLQGAAGVYQY